MKQGKLANFDTHDWEDVAEPQMGSVRADRLRCRRCGIYYSFLDRSAIGKSTMEMYGSRQILYEQELENRSSCNEQLMLKVVG